MEDLSAYFEVLEIKPESTRDQINQAHRDLVNIWHPDRFEHNQRLKEKAAEKLKLINNAYDKLKNYQPMKTSPSVETPVTIKTDRTVKSTVAASDTASNLNPKMSIITKIVILFGGSVIALLALFLLFLASREGHIGYGIFASLILIGYIALLNYIRTFGKTTIAKSTRAGVRPKITIASISLAFSKNRIKIAWLFALTGAIFIAVAYLDLDKEHFKWWFFSGISPFVLFLWGFLKKCPKCSRWWAENHHGSELLDKWQTSKDIPREEVTKNSKGQIIRRRTWTETVIVNVEKRRHHYSCKYCDAEWTVVKEHHDR